MINCQLAAELRPSAELRNELHYTSLDVDREQVVQAVPLAITQYGEYVRQVAAFLAERAT